MTSKRTTVVKMPPLEAMCWVVVNNLNPDKVDGEVEEHCPHLHTRGKLTCRWHSKHDKAARMLRLEHRNVSP